MKVIYRILLLILIYSSVYSQTTWQMISPGLTTNILRGQHFINVNTGYLVGDKGTIFKTTNEGSNWIRQNISSDSNKLITLTAVCFKSADSGFAVGSIGWHGVLLTTTNGGLNWTTKVIVNNYYLTDVKFTSPNTGFLVGVHNVVFKTTDGGGLWTQQSFPGLRDFFSISYVSANSIWLSTGSQAGLIYRTTDGGLNWISRLPTPIPCTSRFNSVCALSEKECWVAGENGSIAVSHDSGMTYTCLNRFSSERFTSIDFKSDSIAIIVGSRGTIYRTTNYGNNWTKIVSGTIADLYSIEFVTSEKGRIVGQGGTVLYTTDGGLTWISQSNENAYVSSFKSIFFISDSTGWVCGTSGTILKTNNGGVNFISQITGTSKTLNSIKFISNQTGYAVGDSGTILKTTNGGINWNLLSSGTNNNLQSISLTSIDSAWVCGWNGIILQTTNGGSNWIQQNSLTTENLYSIVVSNNGFGITADYWFKRTANYGNSWEIMSSNIGTIFGPIYSIYFPSTNIGYATGFWSNYKTVDEGFNWTRVLGSTATGPSFSSVYFTSNDTGYMVGPSGEIKTTNGGINWTNIPDGNDNQLNSVYFSSRTTGWAAGDQGIIMKIRSDILVSNNENNSISEKGFLLYQNYPNPFNPVTVIRYQLAVSSNTLLKVFDVLGNEIRTLVSGKQNAGSYEIEFDGNDLASGIYYYKLSAGEFIETKKMILLK